MAHCACRLGQNLHQSIVGAVARRWPIIAFALNDAVDQTGGDAVNGCVFVDQGPQFGCLVWV